jgi:hypothetical protein
MYMLQNYILMLAFFLITSSYTSYTMSESASNNYVAITIHDESTPARSCQPHVQIFKAVYYGIGVMVGIESCIPLFFGEAQDPKNIGELTIEGIMAVSGAVSTTLCGIELTKLLRDQCNQPQSASSQ